PLSLHDALPIFLFLVTRETMEVQPSVGGKLSTFLQLASVAIVLVSLTGPGLVAPAIRELVFLLTGAVTASAGLQYMYRGLAWLQRQGEPATARTDPSQRPVEPERQSRIHRV